MKKTLIILTILILFLLVLLTIWKKDKPAQAFFTIEQDYQDLMVDDLQVFEQQEITTSQGEKYRAYSLTEIFSALKLNTTELREIEFESIDGAVLKVNASELENLYLIKVDYNDSDYIRLIIPQDEFPQRWLKYIETIKLR